MIDQRPCPLRFSHIIRKAKNNPWKYALLAGLILVCSYLFFVVVLMATLYKDKAAPNLYVSDVDVGSLNYDEALNSLKTKLESTSVTVTLDEQKHSATATELGLAINEDELKNTIKSKDLAQWVMPWLVTTNADLKLSYDPDLAEEFFAKFESSKFKSTKNADFSIKDDQLVISEHKVGIGIDVQDVMNRTNTILGQNLSNQEFSAEATEIQPQIYSDDLRAISSESMTKVSIEYAYKYDDITTKLSLSSIGGLLNAQKLNEGAINIVADKKAAEKLVKSISGKLESTPVAQVTNKYLSGRQSDIETAGQNGRKVTNHVALTNELVAKIDSSQPYTLAFEFEDIPFESKTVEVDDVTVTATYTYNIEVWGAVSSGLAEFKASAAETLASANGWSGAGISFAEVASGGSFTLVLASPDRVAAASSGCSAEYSCRVGRYVIINDQRWQIATPTWNASGGGLRDYRHMVVNHEVGHWLGFGHIACGGAGQLAPVMLQQSIDLGGCRFNPWPTKAELDSIR